MVGPFGVVGEHVEVGAGTETGPHVVLEGWTTIGRDCRIGTGTVIGAAPQDHKYAGGRSYVRIGDRNTFREYTAVHRAADPEGVTAIGNDNYIMGMVHVAHNCTIGNHTTITNLVGLSGHIVIEDHAVLGGMTAYHQHTRVGAYAIVGGSCTVRMDVVPFALASGEPMRVYGLNREGLKRNGFTPDQQRILKAGFRILFWSGLNTTEAVARLKAEMGGHEHVAHLIRFVEASQRGLTPGLRVGSGERTAHEGEEA